MGKISKKQYIIIILLLVAVVLYNYNNSGNSKPIFDPINVIVYFLSGIILIIVLGIIFKPRYCPNCGTRLPSIRFPQNGNETLYGWTSCPKCKAEIDNNGQIVN
jgi:hypothetical protein